MMVVTDCLMWPVSMRGLSDPFFLMVLGALGVKSPSTMVCCIRPFWNTASFLSISSAVVLPWSRSRICCWQKAAIFASLSSTLFRRNGRTGTKLDAEEVSREAAQEITAAVDIPVVAIGGINKKNILELKGTGVDGVALVSAIFGAENIEEECKTLKALSAEMVQA